jgi:hypothetical protein
MAILDDLHSVPLNSFREELGRVKPFTLGQMGFRRGRLEFCKLTIALQQDLDTLEIARN